MKSTILTQLAIAACKEYLQAIAILSVCFIKDLCFMVVRFTVELCTVVRCLYVQTDPPRVVLKTQQSRAQVRKKTVSRTRTTKQTAE